MDSAAMTDSDKVIVDTHVIFDVTGADPVWLEWSQEQMSRFPGRLIVNPLVYTELCYQTDGIEEVDATLEFLGRIYQELPREALFLAARAFKAYRQQGGNRTSPLADFYIGAHAQASGLPILTRDKGRYQTYFPNVSLICP
jgi:predicted nucleic acid-binding protein